MTAVASQEEQEQEQQYTLQHTALSHGAIQKLILYANGGGLAGTISTTPQHTPTL